MASDFLDRILLFIRFKKTPQTNQKQHKNLTINHLYLQTLFKKPIPFSIIQKKWRYIMQRHEVNY